MKRDPFKTLRSYSLPSGQSNQFYSLPALTDQFPSIARLPVSMRIVLESVVRNCDGTRVTDTHIEQVATWQATGARSAEIPFVVSRVVLQDFTGVPLLADLAAMRSTAARQGADPARIEPRVPVDLVVDHSVMIDHFGTRDALDLNMKIEFQRNRERYEFIKWGMQAFQTFGVVPPGFGIVHQINLEYLARGIHTDSDGVSYPDTLVGTDSHTTMINGLGVVGWGVGGIEAEAAMLGQPVYMLTPDVIGVNLTGKLREGVTATDLVLTITEMLRREKVVGKFVEFHGEGTASLTLPDRATIANMAPEYGATMGFFPVDDKTLDYLRGTGRTNEQVDAFEAYFRAQSLFGVPAAGDIDYTRALTLDLGSVSPSLAGPKRPQDRVELGNMKDNFADLFSAGPADNGFNQAAAKLGKQYQTADGLPIRNGDILIAAITSCTNTSNPGVMLAAGLMARKAVEAGLTVKPHVKTSLAPGSRVVTSYLEKTGLLPYLEKLGFDVAAYGCTTCIGNAGDLADSLNALIQDEDLICAAVLSGNRNFEARIHPNVKANFLASPPLVLAYALAGNVLVDLMSEPLGTGKDGREVWLRDIWPASEEVEALVSTAMDPEVFRANYAQVKSDPGVYWEQINGASGPSYPWPASTYIAEPPFFENFEAMPLPLPSRIEGARILALFGDSITTDHISPAGSIAEQSPAGQWLIENGVRKPDFNSYGSRRGNHDVMMRGTFANVRIKNLMLPPLPGGSHEEGGMTLLHPGGKKLPIYDAAMQYQSLKTPTVIFAGEEYGTGSSRDWAAKGTQLLGVKAVVARSFERIHRSNLIGMGVLPLQFKDSDGWQSLGLDGSELIAMDLPEQIEPQQMIVLTITNQAGTVQSVSVQLRIDTEIEVAYYQHGGILPFVLRELISD